MIDSASGHSKAYDNPPSSPGARREEDEMPDHVSPDRVTAIAAAARIPLPEGAAARISAAVGPMVLRYAAANITMPLETEPSSYLVVQHKDSDR
jgi:hypothetical protein